VGLVAELPGLLEHFLRDSGFPFGKGFYALPKPKLCLGYFPSDEILYRDQLSFPGPFLLFWQSLLKKMSIGVYIK